MCEGCTVNEYFIAKWAPQAAYCKHRTLTATAFFAMACVTLCAPWSGTVVFCLSFSRWQSVEMKKPAIAPLYTQLTAKQNHCLDRRSQSKRLETPVFHSCEHHSCVHKNVHYKLTASPNAPNCHQLVCEQPGISLHNTDYEWKLHFMAPLSL